MKTFTFVVDYRLLLELLHCTIDGNVYPDRISCVREAASYYQDFDGEAISGSTVPP